MLRALTRRTPILINSISRVARMTTLTSKQFAMGAKTKVRT